jgi:hypothetical protein
LLQYHFNIIFLHFDCRGFGGCNDLIISGHGAFWTLAPLAFQTYYPQYR